MVILAVASLLVVVFCQRTPDRRVAATVRNVMADLEDANDFCPSYLGGTSAD